MGDTDCGGNWISFWLLADKVCLVKAMVFPVVVWMWQLDHKESLVQRINAFKLGCWTLENPLDYKEIQQSILKGNQSWIFIGRTAAEAEALILWPPDVKKWLIGKDPDAGKDWRREEKGTTEDEMVGWHHRFDGHEFEQAPGAGDG